MEQSRYKEVSLPKPEEVEAIIVNTVQEMFAQETDAEVKLSNRITAAAKWPNYKGDPASLIVSNSNELLLLQRMRFMVSASSYHNTHEIAKKFEKELHKLYNVKKNK